MIKLLCKRWKRITLLFITLLLLTVIILYQQTNRLEPTNSQSSTLAFTNSSWIELPIAVNGNNAYGLFDTGANICVVDIESINKYNITKLPLVPIRVNNKEWSSLLIIRELTIGNFCFKNVLAIALNLKKNNTRLSCANSDIIIGTPIIRQLGWEFNFDNNKFTIQQLPKKEKQYDSTTTLKLSNLRLPQTRIQVNNNTHSVLVDFGQTSSVLLNLKQFDSTSYVKTSSSANANVFGNFYDEQYQTITDIIIGNDTIENSRITLSTKSNFPNLIGLGFFRNYSLISINPSKREISLHNPRTGKRMSEFYGYGFSFDLTHGALTVNGIAELSPAHKAGIQFGDTIVSINGCKTELIWGTLNFCEFLNKRDSLLNTDSLQLSINRSDTFNIILKKGYY